MEKGAACNLGVGLFHRVSEKDDDYKMVVRNSGNNKVHPSRNPGYACVRRAQFRGEAFCTLIV